LELRIIEGFGSGKAALEGVRVIDASTVLAGPLIGAILGDFGADVIKVEHPEGDSLREFGKKKDGKPLWWKVINRNKRCVTLNLKLPTSQEAFKKLVMNADVLVENFRTGTLASWGIDPEVLMEINPRLVVVSVTGFGQTGPYARRPGFGTLAEAFSGFSHVTGQADGPPTLPPVGLADSIAGLFGTFSTMIALYERDVKGSGRGQRIDVSLYEPLFSTLSALATTYSELGDIAHRMGNRSANSAPRNIYKTSDGRWVAVAATTPSIVQRVLDLTGGPEVAADERFATVDGRMENALEVDRIVGDWIARHELVEVLKQFEVAEAAISPVNDIEQIMHDAQYLARNDIVDVPDVELGTVKMQNAFPFLSRTPGIVRFAGAPKGFHNREVLIDDLGLSPTQISELEKEGVIFSPEDQVNR
jgi:formyl-CoA transferase